MRIVHEKIDNENYLELCISPKEFELIKDYMIVSKRVLLEGFITNFGVKLELDLVDEEEDEYI